MGLLDHLWDDTLAGPAPDSGLGKLSKYATFSSRSNSVDNESGFGVDNGRSVDAGVDGNMSSSSSSSSNRVTRSIMIIIPNKRDSPPVSPAGSTPPLSPFGGSPGASSGRFRRRSGSFAYERASGIGPRNPPPPHDL